jgi:hypothetical protein
MSNYKSRVVSVRLDSDVLDTIREQAKLDGRSVSGEILFFVREQLVSRPKVAKRPRRITGWLAHQPSPDTYAEFRKARAEASAHLQKAIRDKARRK